MTQKLLGLIETSFFHSIWNSVLQEIQTLKTYKKHGVHYTDSRARVWGKRSSEIVELQSNFVPPLLPVGLLVA